MWKDAKGEKHQKHSCIILDYLCDIVPYLLRLHPKMALCIMDQGENFSEDPNQAVMDLFRYAAPPAVFGTAVAVNCVRQGGTLMAHNN